MLIGRALGWLSLAKALFLGYLAVDLLATGVGCAGFGIAVLAYRQLSNANDKDRSWLRQAR